MPLLNPLNGALIVTFIFVVIFYASHDAMSTVSFTRRARNLAAAISAVSLVAIMILLFVLSGMVECFEGNC